MKYSDIDKYRRKINIFYLLQGSQDTAVLQLLDDFRTISLEFRKTGMVWYGSDARGKSGSWRVFPCLRSMLKKQMIENQSLI